MATRTRETTPGKEKRGTSPSFPRKTSNSKPNSPDKTASDKHIPNYLKPTISSGLDVSKQLGKKPASNDSANTPNIARRRSFDKPPPLYCTQKSRVSPSPSFRSSSFSAKTSTSHKSVPDKSLKTPPKDAGKHGVISRPLSTVKKSSPSNKKQDAAESPSKTKEQVTSPAKSEDLQVEIQQEPESSITDAEDEEKLHVVSYNEFEPEIIAMEDKEPISILHEAEPEPENIIDEDVVTIDSYTDSEQLDISLEAETKELPADESKIETTTCNQQKFEENALNENNDRPTDEIVGDDAKGEREDKEGAKALDGFENTDEQEMEIKLETEDETPKQEMEEEVVEETKPETEDETAKQEDVIEKTADETPKQEDTEKKKDSAVSNDVIEETASKLREQRRNKVKALAGAFETVISLQEPK